MSTATNWEHFLFNFNNSIDSFNSSLNSLESCPEVCRDQEKYLTLQTRVHKQIVEYGGTVYPNTVCQVRSFTNLLVDFKNIENGEDFLESWPQIRRKCENTGKDLERLRILHTKFLGEIVNLKQDMEKEAYIYEKDSLDAKQKADNNEAWGRWSKVAGYGASALSFFAWPLALVGGSALMGASASYHYEAVRLGKVSEDLRFIGDHLREMSDCATKLQDMVKEIESFLGDIVIECGTLEREGRGKQNLQRATLKQKLFANVATDALAACDKFLGKRASNERILFSIGARFEQDLSVGLLKLTERAEGSE